VSDLVEVSIIMPLYNAAPYFKGSVESVLAQTYERWELLVVDDCSTDGSSELAYEYSLSDPRIKYYKNSVNSGVAASRNVGLEHAVGRFVAFLDSDDQWAVEKLECQVNFALRHTIAISYASYIRVSEAGKQLGVIKPRATVCYRDMLYKNHIGNLTAMYDRVKLPSLRFKAAGHEDYLFWLEALQTAGSAACVPSDKPLAKYLVRASSLSGNKFKAAKWQWENYRTNIGFGLLRSSFYFTCYAVSSLLRKL